MRNPIQYNCLSFCISAVATAGSLSRQGVCPYRTTPGHCQRSGREDFDGTPYRLYGYLRCHALFGGVLV